MCEHFSNLENIDQRTVLFLTPAADFSMLIEFLQDGPQPELDCIIVSEIGNGIKVATVAEFCCIEHAKEAEEEFNSYWHSPQSL